MEFNELTDDQKVKARACGTTEELVALARDEGVELTDSQMELIAGGNIMKEWGCTDINP